MKQIFKYLFSFGMALTWCCCLYAQPNITRVEYYIDGDPGYGSATALSITPGTNLVNLAININPASVSEGVHILGVRARDANGAWSHDNRWLFARPYASDTTAPGPLPNITRVEYYLDSDPGYGNATALAVTPGTNLSNLAINLNPASLAEGVHILGVRARDANGRWSHDNRWLFARPYASDSVLPGPVPNLKQVEYYIDTDPGYGNGIQIAQENVANISNLNVSINISGLSAGDHVLYIRSKDASNAWSLDNKWDFTVSAATNTASIMVNSISKKTMCAGSSFSIGYDAKGTYNTGNIFTAHLSSATGSFTSPTVIGTLSSRALNGIINCVLPASLTTGTGYKIRVVSSSNVVTGTASVDALTINAIPPVPTITASGPTTFCQGGSVTLTASAGSSYLWSNGATTQSINVNASGSFTVTVTSANGCSKTSAATAVTVNPLPTATITAGGVTTFCQGGSVTLTASTGSSYLWSNGATTKSISVTTSGNYTVTVTNATGCSKTSAATSVTVNSKPTPTTTPSGTVNITLPNTVTISVNGTYNSYLWSNGATTSSITVGTAGSYSVTVTNASGCSGTSAPVVVTVSGGCTKPTITASGSTTNVCPGKTVTLTSSAASSYLWSNGATTQSIVVSTPGNYTVTTGAGCTSDATVVTYQGCLPPTGLATSNITATGARINWAAAPCAVGYQYQYRRKGTTVWTTATTTAINRSLTGLTTATTYQWRVLTGCKITPDTVASANATGPEFTTAAAAVSGAGYKQQVSNGGNLTAKLFPNPAKDYTTLQLSGFSGKVTIKLTDMAGKLLWQKDNIDAAQLQIPVSKFSNGNYLVTITSGKENKTLKLVKE